jgi:hypothetical protein
MFTLACCWLYPLQNPLWSASASLALDAISPTPSLLTWKPIPRNSEKQRYSLKRRPMGSFPN